MWLIFGTVGGDGCFRFPGNLDVFIPGKQEPGNEFSSCRHAVCHTALL